MALTDFSKAAYGETAALRYNIYESNPNGFAKKMAPKIEAFYKQTPLSSTNKKLLDIACGTGQLAAYFLEKGYEVTGLDLAPEMLKYAKLNNAKYIKNNKCIFHESDASSFSLNPDNGLAVSTFNGLNHLPDFKSVTKCLSNVYQSLVRGGYFVFDINTQLGLKKVVENFEVVDTDDELTVRKRIFDGNRVVLNASGCFKHEGIWHRYQETIFKIVIHTQELLDAMLKQGWSNVAFTKENLITPEMAPELNEIAYIVARK